MPYVDPQTVHNPATGTVAPATWGDTVRDDLEFLIDPPACSVFNSAAVSVTTGTTFTIMNANSENFDNDGMHSTVSNTSRITAQTAGRYLCLATATYASGTTGFRGLAFLHQGTTKFGEVQISPAAGGVGTAVTTAATRVLTAGQYVEVEARHTQGSNLDVTLVEFAMIFITR